MDWSFLLPWAKDLARVVLYKAREEVDYGTLHDRVDFVSLQLADIDAFAHEQTADERWEELACLREGLEPLALADEHAVADYLWLQPLRSCFSEPCNEPQILCLIVGHGRLSVGHACAPRYARLCCILVHGDEHRAGSARTRVASGATVKEEYRPLLRAVHYDKHAWQYFHDTAWVSQLEAAFPFEIDHPHVQAHWQLCFHDATRGRSDSERALRAGVDMLTRMPQGVLGAEYHKAKRRLRELVGEAWDDAYRVPVSLAFAAPDINQDSTQWLSVVDELVHSLKDPTGCTGESLVLGPITLSLAKLPVMHFTNELVLTMLNAYAHLPELTLALAFNDTASIAPTINDAVGIFPIDTEPNDRFVDTLVLHGSSGTTQFAGWCSAVEPKASASSRSKTRSPTKRQMSGIKEEFLTRDDVEQLVAQRYAATDNSPPPTTLNEQPRAVQLAAKSLVCLPSKETEPLERLGFTYADEFLVLEDNNDDGEWMSVLMPGYGRCRVSCASIDNSRHLEQARAQSHGKSTLRRLNLHLDRCEPAALPMITAHFGKTLTSLNVLMTDNITLNESQLQNILHQAPALRFLSLRRVTIGSMDVILEAYRSKTCRIHSLSLWNSWVDRASLTRFAFELADPKAVMNSHLREFRFNYDDLDEDSLRLLDDDTVAAFAKMLKFNKSLTFFETALEEELYTTYGDRFIALDGAIKVPAVLDAVKWAFLSVVTDLEPEDAGMALQKKRRRATRCVLPTDSRADIVKRIWSFLSPVERIARTVSAAFIQPEGVAPVS